MVNRRWKWISEELFQSLSKPKDLWLMRTVMTKVLKRKVLFRRAI
jgi:hypothetical protein